MGVNESAPVRASAAIEIKADPEVVWNVLASIKGWPKWNPDVKSVSLSGEVTPGTTFQWKSGPGTIRSTFQIVDRPRLLAWTGRTLGIRAVHVWRLERKNGHTIVTSDESWEGLIARVLRRQCQKMLESAVKTGPAYLKAEAERRSTT
jgi:hypothetical protein